MELLSKINLQPHEQKLFDSFLAEERKKQWLACRIMIRSLLVPEDFPVEYDPTGKPFLPGSSYNISVSHSRERAAVILSRNHQVGIDIEKITPRILRVREKFLNERELSSWAHTENLELLTLAWSAKEAIYKLYGLRNLDFRKNITLHLPDTGLPMNFTGVVGRGDFHREYTLSGEKIDDYILVYVLDRVI